MDICSGFCKNGVLSVLSRIDEALLMRTHNVHFHDKISQIS